jgi:hypothetical protein
MNPKFDNDEPFSPDATQRFRAISATTDTGTHRWLHGLGDAVAELGDGMAKLSEKVTAIRITQSEHVKRTEVAAIAKQANGQLEGQVRTLNTLVFGVLILIILAIGGDVFMWAHGK